MQLSSCVGKLTIYHVKLAICVHLPCTSCSISSALVPSVVITTGRMVEKKPSMTSLEPRPGKSLERCAGEPLSQWNVYSSNRGEENLFIFPFSSPVESRGLSAACHSVSRAPSIDFSAPLLSPSHHSLSRPGPLETDIGRVSICFLHLWHVLRLLMSFVLSAASESCDTPHTNNTAAPNPPTGI